MSGPGFASIDAREREYVAAALDEGTLMRYRMGLTEEQSFVYRFERAAEQELGARHCLAVNSGTSALLTSLVALGIGPGDEVIVPAYTFIASIAAIAYCGATPVLAEIDESLTLDPRDVERRITARTRAVMPVHMLGVGADMDRLTGLAQEYGLLVIEDVAQACGGSFKGRRLGTIGDMGAFSMNHFKVLTAGEGGFCLTDSLERYETAYAFHDHGFRPNRDGAVEADAMFGLNLRMPDLSGALALAQLEKLDVVLERTRSVNARLGEAIGEVPGARPRRLPDPEGHCATTLTYVFDQAAVARSVAQRLGTTTLIESGKHYYANMPQLAGLAKDRRKVSPLGSAAAHSGDRPPSYARGSMPRTDSILARSIALSTGMSDWYAGTAFGVALDSDADAVKAAAGAFHDAVERGARA